MSIAAPGRSAVRVAPQQASTLDLAQIAVGQTLPQAAAFGWRLDRHAPVAPDVGVHPHRHPS